MKRKRRKKKAPPVDRSRWEELTEGYNNVFEINPSTNILTIACCDCGSVHDLNMDIIKGSKLRVKVNKDYRATKSLRRRSHYEYTSRY